MGPRISNNEAESSKGGEKIKPVEFFCYQLDFTVCNRKLTLCAIIFAESAKTAKIVISVKNIREK